MSKLLLVVVGADTMDGGAGPQQKKWAALSDQCQALLTGERLSLSCPPYHPEVTHPPVASSSLPPAPLS